MIISCPSCKKKFQIDATLVPEEGRDLQCGSCKYVWFYKKKNENFSPLTLNEDLVNNEIKDNSDNKKIETKNESTGGKFFSYLIVLIISFIALIILIDTLKTPIINVFPGAEIIFFNLFETLQDIKLFIIDLS